MKSIKIESKVTNSKRFKTTGLRSGKIYFNTECLARVLIESKVVKDWTKIGSLTSTVHWYDNHNDSCNNS